MKNRYCLLGLLFLTAIKLCYANPLPPAEVTSISISPPAITIQINDPVDSLDASGYRIYTLQDTAIINQGTVFHDIPYEILVITLDSSNTSGFIINPEHDIVYTDLEVYGFPPIPSGCAFGTDDDTPAPPKGSGLHASQCRIYGMPDFWFPCFSINNVRWDPGFTDVIINEVNSHCVWGDNCNFVELYNLSDEAICLDGFKLVCDTIYDLPSDAFIPAHGYYVIDESDFPSLFDMDSDLDNLYLVNPFDSYPLTGDRIVDQVGWDSDHGENISFMRYPDGDVDSTQYMSDFRGYNDSTSTTFENGFPTRGAPNRHDCPGFVAIGARADSTGEGTARIHWTDPIWDEGFDYSVLVSNDDHFPQTSDDGNTIYQGSGQEFIDSNIPPVGPTFYTLFAHNIGGGYSTPTGESQAYIYFNSASIEEDRLPSQIDYLNCYPNPFNAQATISFSLAKAGDVEIAIYDLTGRLVETVADGYYAAGKHAVIWDAGSNSTGIYFAKLQSLGYSVSQKVVLIK